MSFKCLECSELKWSTKELQDLVQSYIKDVIFVKKEIKNLKLRLDIQNKKKSDHHDMITKLLKILEQNRDAFHELSNELEFGNLDSAERERAERDIDILHHLYNAVDAILDRLYREQTESKE